MTTRAILDALIRYKSLNEDLMNSLLSTTNSKIDSIIGYWSKVKFDVNDFIKINLADTEIMQPSDFQSRWAESITFLGSGARTASGAGSNTPVDKFSMLAIIIEVTAVSGTFAAGQGLTVYIEGKNEITGKYVTLYDSSTDLGAQITSPTMILVDVNKNKIFEACPFMHLRVRWTISGTNPSFTFGVYGVGKV